jgi:hypothetical protein
MAVNRLTALGVHVFAGCLTLDGINQFAKDPLVTALLMDVTKEEQVAKSFETIKEVLGNQGIHFSFVDCKHCGELLIMLGFALSNLLISFQFLT